MNYKLLKDLPNIKAGVQFELLPNEKYYKYKYDTVLYHTSIVENNSDWFSPIPSHPTKEEIIQEECLNNGGHLERDVAGLNRNSVRKCLEKHEESIKQQLIEKIENSYYVKVVKCESEGERIVEGLIELIRNFKSE